MGLKIKRITNKSRVLLGLKDRQADPFAIQEDKFSFRQLKEAGRFSDWTEDSFLADDKSKGIVTRSFKTEQLKYFAILVIFALTILVLRTAWLQIFKNDYYYLLSENNRLRAEIIEPRRGIIYDRNHQPLVRNKANFVLYFRPIDLPKDELARDKLIRQISLILEGGTIEEADIFTPDVSTTTLDLVMEEDTFYQIKEMLAKVKIGSLESYQPLFIRDNIDYDQAMLITLRLPNWPGVFLSNKIRREYVNSVGDSSLTAASSLSHILGYTGKINAQEFSQLSGYSLIDYIGKVGLEYSWEKELKGQAGRKNIEVDALGRQKKIVNEVAAIDGSSLLLSLDLDLQQKAEEVIRQYLNKAHLARASVVIMDPNNGEVLALVSLPGYNNNLFASGISQLDYDKFLNDSDQPLFNRAISGEFPSGSTIKPIFAAAGLQERVITEKTSFLSTGGLNIGAWFFPDWKAGGHGLTNVRKALALSVNTFFYYLGGGYGDFKGLGLDNLVKYAKLFGLGQTTGLDLPGEATGFVPTQKWKEETKDEPWYIGDTYHFAIGQGDVLVTPLQVANYTAAIANGGTLYQAHLVSKLLGDVNQGEQDILPKVLQADFITADNLRIVREGMRQTVTLGSAQFLNSLPIEVAGKTGTAQWSSQKDNHAWFTGFAPYNQPSLVITVLVEEGIEGSTIAVPIAHDILNWYFSH